MNNDLPVNVSALQLGLALFATGVGAQMVLVSNELISTSGNLAWISVVVGGVMYWAVTILMLKLALSEKNRPFTLYIRQLWGNYMGSILILWFILIFELQVITYLQRVGKLITMFLFDQTPEKVVILTLLIVCAYGASQKINVILRIQTFIALSSLPLLLIWLLSFMFFDVENILPLWPINSKKVISGAFICWNMFSGYESILMILPWVRFETKAEVQHAIKTAFIAMTVIFCTVMIIVIGALGEEPAQKLTYPAINIIKGVELPGTFVERLENYLLIFWIPIVYDTLIMFIYVPAAAMSEYFSFKEHLPFVWFFIPILYFGSMLIDLFSVLEMVEKITLYSALTFSFGVVPLSLLKSRWMGKNRMGESCAKSECRP